MLNSAIITPVLAAGSVASPYIFQVNISQRLCSPTCVGQTPVFNPVFSLVGYSQVGAGAYVATVNVQGLISYMQDGQLLHEDSGAEPELHDTLLQRGRACGREHSARRSGECRVRAAVPVVQPRVRQ